jgi:hypothetical protein
MNTTAGNTPRAHNPAEYRYEPLTSSTSIRLLQLNAPSTGPNGNDAGLTGSLVTVDLRLRQTYEALSYVWGSQQGHHYITIDGLKLRIRRNLAATLYRIRRKSEVCVVWIDAICINQNDDLERGHQVKHMARIYREASKVLVYLGEKISGPWSYNSSTESLECQGSPLTHLQQMRNDRAFRSKIVSRTKRYLRERSMRIPLRLRSALPPVIEAMIALTKQTWFNRVWTTQEIGLASRASVFLGAEILPWDDFTEVYRMMSRELSSHELSDLNFRPDRIALLHNFFQQPGGSFLDVLAQTHARGASDPRDRVFAILSHPSAKISPNSGPVVEVNYAWDLPEVYRQTAIGIIKQMGNLDILSYVWQTMEDRLQGPSWTPHWDCGDYTNLLIKAYRRPRASRDRNLNLKRCLKQTRHGESRGTLRLRGWKVGAIENMSQSFSKRELLSSSPLIAHTKWLPVRLPRTIINVYRKFRAICSDYYEHDFLSVFGNTLTANLLDPQYHHKTGLDQYQADLGAFSKAMLEGSNMSKDLLSLPQTNSKGSYHHFAKSAWYACHGRKLFSVDAGYLGLGPKFLEPGDVIYILHGGSVPYVLRPAGRHRYRLVGECYIEGLMEGEADDYWRQEHRKCPKWARKIREITLC